MVTHTEATPQSTNSLLLISSSDLTDASDELFSALDIESGSVQAPIQSVTQDEEEAPLLLDVELDVAHARTLIARFERLRHELDNDA